MEVKTKKSFNDLIKSLTEDIFYEEDLEEIASIEQFPAMEGRQLVMLMAPIKK